MSYGLSMQASLWPNDEAVLSASEYQRHAAALRPALQEILRRERLDHSLLEPLSRVYLPLAAWVHRQKRPGATFILGVCGAQGSGKSTLLEFLTLILRQAFGYHVAGFSIDDFYLTHEEREKLARTVHPLLATRGVPGTHDVELALAVIEACATASDTVISAPRFSKTIDDRLPPEAWQQISCPADIVILEGWCVGAAPQAPSQLAPPLNELEQREDADGSWRNFVNEQLAGHYARLFARLDRLVMLKVPDMACVYEWRSLQEDKLAPDDPRRLMDSSGLKRFIMHYERLTRHMLDEMPDRADVVLYLAEQHQFTSIHLNH